MLISVSDTGVGSPAGTADEIFNALFTTKPQGGGMDLAISKSIVESHGGRIWANGDGGRGATFHFTSPTGSRRNKPSRRYRVFQHSAERVRGPVGVILMHNRLTRRPRISAGMSASVHKSSPPAR